ncbi:MAG: TonB-dependent receptor [Rhodoferax sp.]|nr:TonB-dependent receptor [Rhodoferax sp.]
MTVDGYRANSGAERKQFNGKIGFDPNDQLHVNVVFNQFDMPLALDPLGLTRAQLKADPTQAGNGALKFQTRKTVLQNQLGSSATYTLDRDRSLTGRAYYGTRDNLQYQAGTPAATATNGLWTGLNRAYFGVGLQYNERSVWASTPVEWAAGYEFDRSREYRQGGQTLAGQKTGLPTRSEDNQSENSDWFVQGTAQLTDTVSLTTGLRQSLVRFVSDDYYITPTDPNGSGNMSYQATSPVLGFTWHATEDVNLYANYGKGFETPTLAEMAYQVGPAATVVGQFNPTLNASSSQHYEIGAKWVPGPGSRLDFALYQIDTVDEIVTARSVSGQTAFKNAPGTARSGWELSGSTELTPHLVLSASASMIDAHYAQAWTSGATPIANGNKLPGIPQSLLFSELAWTSAPAAAAAKEGLRLGVELVQAGRIYANDTNTESADGHSVLNLSASQRWSLGKGALTAYARINNASDERYVGSVIVNQAQSQFYEPGLPQNWTLGLSLNLPL